MILDQGLLPERASSGKWVKYKQSLSVLVLVFQFWGKFEMASQRTVFGNELMLVKHYCMTDM